MQTGPAVVLSYFLWGWEPCKPLVQYRLNIYYLIFNTKCETLFNRFKETFLLAGTYFYCHLLNNDNFVILLLQFLTFHNPSKS